MDHTEAPKNNPNSSIQKILRDDDPRRCQGMSRGNQCDNKAVPGANYCEIHTGALVMKAQDEKQKFMYNLRKFKQRFSDFTTNPAIKGLREEIGVLRMLLEVQINKCTDESELLLHSTSISGLVMSIEKLVASCHKLEINLGQLLDKSKAIQLADELIQIITSEIKDEDRIRSIAAQITSAMARITVSEESK